MALVIDSAPAASSLAPGFRFHPTDEELVRYYLRRKVCGKPFRFDAISDVDVYKVEPWDLPGLSRLKSRDLEWYFFSVLDKKYGNGSRTNRATDKGYWKTTGKDRAVHHRSQQVGMKKTLVYHSGRAPRGERTNWVMHEYRLIDQELEKAGIVQDAFVLCRIFHKSGSGPKNGEKYGAPFIEEEWEDDDELVFVPKQENCAEELPVDDDSFLDANDIEQILGTDMPKEDGPLPLDSYQGDDINHGDMAMTDDPQNTLAGIHENTHPDLVKQKYTGEPSNTMNFDVDYLLDEPYFDATTGDLPLDESLFFEANDLENTLNTDPGIDMLNEDTSFFSPDIRNKNVLPESSLTLVNVNEETRQASEASQPFEGHSGDTDSGPTDISYPFLKKASYMLGNISAPPAFASEFPTKYLASASHASSSVHVRAGMIHVSNVSFIGGAVDFSLGKHTQLNIVLSFGSASQHQTPKANSGAFRGWVYCVFLWVLVLSLGFKIGSLMCLRSFMS